MESFIFMLCNGTYGKMKTNNLPQKQTNGGWILSFDLVPPTLKKGIDCNGYYSKGTLKVTF